MARVFNTDVGGGVRGASDATFVNSDEDDNSVERVVAVSKFKMKYIAAVPG
jgi:hypothetical protein